MEDPPYEINLSRPYEDDLEKGIQREECAICLDNNELSYNTWVELKVCSHAFHKNCIDMWLARHIQSVCPLCMRDINQQEENNRSIVINNEVVVLPQRLMTIRRELEEKCVCILSCLCCIAVFILPPIMIFTGKN